MKKKAKAVPITVSKTVPAGDMPISIETKERSFAIFAVGFEWFAIDLDSILEILHSFEIISVPHMPDSFCGVTSLRGESVPVVDSQKLLKQESKIGGAKSCIITLMDATKIGFLVDSDVEVVNLNQGRFCPLPDCYTKDEAKFLEGIFWIGDKFVGIIKPNQALEVLTEWRKENEEK